MNTRGERVVNGLLTRLLNVIVRVAVMAWWFIRPPKSPTGRQRTRRELLSVLAWSLRERSKADELQAARYRARVKPRLWLGMIVGVCLAAAFASWALPASHGRFPSELVLTMAALIPAETFLLGFAQSAWRDDYARRVDHLVALNDELLDHFSAGPARRRLALFRVSVQQLADQADAALAAIDPRYAAEQYLQTLEMRREIQDDLRKRAQDPRLAQHLETERRAAEAEQRDRHLRTLWSEGFVGDRYFAAARGTAVLVIIVAILGLGYIDWERVDMTTLAVTPGAVQVVSLLLAAIGIYYLAGGVRRHLRSRLHETLRDRLTLLEIAALDYPESPDSESDSMGWHDGSPTLWRHYDMNPMSAPVAARMAAQHLYFARLRSTREPHNQPKNSDAQAALQVLESFVRRTSDGTGWDHDVVDADMCYLAALATAELGDQAEARELYQRAARARMVDSRPASVEGALRSDLPQWCTVLPEH